MEVFVVFNIGHITTYDEHPEPVAVFSTRAKAEAYVDHMRIYDHEIVSLPLNPEESSNDHDRA